MELPLFSYSLNESSGDKDGTNFLTGYGLNQTAEEVWKKQGRRQIVPVWKCVLYSIHGKTIEPRRLPSISEGLTLQTEGKEGGQCILHIRM